LHFPEVLSDPAVVSKMADTKAAGEVKALETFYTLLQTEPARAFYGPGHVEKANAVQAIEMLLISDNLFRCVSFNASLKIYHNVM
jgi:protein pelota